MGRIASWTLGLFFVTTGVAALLGILLAVIVQPGRGQPLGEMACMCMAVADLCSNSLHNAAQHLGC